MATRTIIECDRHHGEIQAPAVTVAVGERSYDLCARCKAKLERFLAGEELEVPP